MTKMNIDFKMECIRKIQNQNSQLMLYLLKKNIYNDYNDYTSTNFIIR